MNVVNAGCCNKDKDNDNGNGNTGKKLPSNLEIYIEDEALVNINDCFRNNDVWFKELEKTFKVNKNDLETDVYAFKGNGNKNFLFVCTKMFYDKQDQSIKNNKLRPIGNTGYYACCIENGFNLSKDEFVVIPVKGEPGKFEFKRVVNILPD